MRNSRFIPAKNRFMRKALGITSKVMLFGVLLSLFLFACVGMDTLEEVAQAGTPYNSDYNDIRDSAISFYYKNYERKAFDVFL